MIVDIIRCEEMLENANSKREFMRLLNVSIHIATSNEYFQRFVVKYTPLLECNTTNFIYNIKNSYDEFYRGTCNVINNSNRNEQYYGITRYLKEIIRYMHQLYSLPNNKFDFLNENLKDARMTQAAHILNSINIIGMCRMQENN